MTARYLAVELGEILFTFEAESQAGAEGYADLVVFGEVRDCHHMSWCKNGEVMTPEQYKRKYPQPNEAAVRY